MQNYQCILMSLNTLRQRNKWVNAWTLKPEQLSSNHSSAPCSLCNCGKKTTSLQVLVSSSITWEKLDLAHKVVRKLNEIPNSCKEDISIFRFCAKRAKKQRALHGK